MLELDYTNVKAFFMHTIGKRQTRESAIGPVLMTLSLLLLVHAEPAVPWAEAMSQPPVCSVVTLMLLIAACFVQLDAVVRHMLGLVCRPMHTTSQA
jgi:hypothetical protein